MIKKLEKIEILKKGQRLPFDTESKNFDKKNFEFTAKAH